jgi:carboxyl-terminal processing protease
MRRTTSLSTVLFLSLLPVGLAAQATATRPESEARRPDGGANVEAQVFVSALQAIGQLYQTPLSDSTLWAQALDGLIESLNDPYAAVFTPEEAEVFEEDNTGNYAGIGVQITQLNDRVTVTAVFRSTPADQAGMQVGDVIVGVNVHDAEEWSSDMVADSVRGPVGTTVDVTVRREGYDTPLSFPITRDQVHVPAVEADDLEGGVTYVVMDRVARNAAREMDEILQEHSSASGIILDLRRNPGGYLDESLMLADLFLKPGQRLASTRSRNPSGASDTREESWDARMIARVPATPIVVLVDEFTASAAEILAGALQDYDRALVVGQRTFGKGVVQTVLDLPYDRRIRFTTGSWYTPLGRSLHRPRDASGRPLEEDVDTFPKVASAAGRELVAAGGIFPDLAVPYDTLTLKERELLGGAAEAGVPLPLRIAEFGFSEARVLEAADRAPELREEAFQDFLGQLRDEGMPADLLDSEEALAYLRWRARISVADRMDRLGSSVMFRMERDNVLAEAYRLLLESPTQTELFAHAESVAADQESPVGDGDGAPERDGDGPGR